MSYSLCLSDDYYSKVRIARQLRTERADNILNQVYLSYLYLYLPELLDKSNSILIHHRAPSSLQRLIPSEPKACIVMQGAS